MQGKEQKISPIKQRILKFADTLGISKRDFYKKIGVSRGTLESKTGITEEVMAKFIAAYPEVSLEWLINGIDEMKATDMIDTSQSKNISLALEDKFINTISQQAEKIGRLEAEIEHLKRETAGRRDAEGAGVAGVG